MRYQNWDVLVFPGLPEQCKIPLQEFKTSCTVIQDAETHSYQSSPHLLPTVTSFISSLESGSPFRISIHCWQNPELSRHIQAIKKPSDNVIFEARLFIDGRIVGSRWFHQNGPWPTVIEMSINVDKTGEFEKLKFPSFHKELLSQSYWNASDDFGRIKLLISEGFAREHLTYPYERVKNVASFSFQHAPLDVLEASAIAWPNAAMWRQVSLVGPYIAQQQQSPRKVSSEVEDHSHSPRRVVRAKQAGRSQGMAPPTNPFPRPAATFDPFTDQIHSAFTGWRQSSGADISMPDYSSSSNHTRANSARHVTDPMSITGDPPLPDNQFELGLEATIGSRPPVNTPQSEGSIRPAIPISFAAIPARKDAQTNSPGGSPRPCSEFAIHLLADSSDEQEGDDVESFTANIHMPAPTTIKSRNENSSRSPPANRPSCTTVDEATRKVSQGLSAVNNANIVNSKRQKIVTPAASKAIDDEDEPRSSPSARKVSRTSVKDGQTQGARRVLSNVTNV